MQVTPIVLLLFAISITPVTNSRIIDIKSTNPFLKDESETPAIYIKASSPYDYGWKAGKQNRILYTLRDLLSRFTKRGKVDEKYVENQIEAMERDVVYKEYNTTDYNITIYNVTTDDGFWIKLIRYCSLEGRETPILMIPGMFENHLLFDYNEERSLARYLANQSWDVWILDLRTHDADGDPHSSWKNEEYMNKCWDLDKTYLDKDVVTAVEFIQDKTKKEDGAKKIVFIGHSMGGLLAYAYAELKDQADLAGMITIGSPGKASELKWEFKILQLYLGFTWHGHVYISSLAPYNLDPNNLRFIRKIVRAKFFYKAATGPEIQDTYIALLDDEPAGAVIDMVYGLDEDWKSGHWWDPQTGYDYTLNLYKINTPFMAIAGDEDTLAKPGDIRAAYENVSSDDKTIKNYTDYGHVDLLLGDNARIDVFPDIAEWLAARYK